MRHMTGRSRSKSASSGSRKPFVSGVRIPPGATQFTRTPWSRYSTASARVRLMTPPFDAQYAALSRAGP